MTKLIGSAVLAMVCAFASAPADAQQKNWTTVRIATEGAFRPWNYTNPDGSLAGFEIDLYKDLCRRMSVTCTMEAQAFDGMIPALNAGKFDAIMAGMSATAKREEVIAFSLPYGSTGLTFATLRDSPLAKLPDTGEVFSLATNETVAVAEMSKLRPFFKGKIIGAQSASIGVAFLAKYFKGVIEVREYKTTEQHDLDLLAGRTDLVMASMAYLSAAVAKPGNSAMIIVGPRFQGGILGRGSSVGLRKNDPELKAMFDKAILEAQTDGTIKKLSETHFGFDVTPR
jgi:octopine/nopaline transport system substrate-binding protein